MSDATEPRTQEALTYARARLALALTAIRDADRNFRDDTYCRECGVGPSVLQHDDPDCNLSPLHLADVSMRAARGAIGEALDGLARAAPQERPQPEPDCECGNGCVMPHQHRDHTPQERPSIDVERLALCVHVALGHHGNDDVTSCVAGFIDQKYARAIAAEYLRLSGSVGE